MNRYRSARLTLPLAAAGLVLVGCVPTLPGATGSPSAAVSETPSASPTPEGPSYTLPADCAAIASPATMNTVFGGIDTRPSNDLVRSAPASATKVLECSWLSGDVTGGDVIFSTTTVGDAEAHIAVLEADGFGCADALGGTRCDRITPPAGEFPVEYVETVFTRDDVWIWIGTANVDVAPLLPDIVATAWGS